MSQEQKLKIQNIEIDNATQATITLVGQKGTGKTTFVKMALDSVKPVLCLDPLNVVKGKEIDAYRIQIKKSDDEEKVKKIAKLVNKIIGENKNVVIYFNEMLQSEMVEKVDWLFPSLTFRNAYIFIDEVHEFCPHFHGSQEVHRAIRHWRNRNIGFMITTQRPASVDTNVIGMTDHLILFRIAWKNDIRAIEELLKYICTKQELNKLLKNLQTCGFMEGYFVNFRK